MKCLMNKNQIVEVEYVWSSLSTDWYIKYILMITVVHVCVSFLLVVMRYVHVV